MPGTSSNRDRRKAQNVQEPVKHRRTRSGCYTCRNRRVKCDEKHPICERCRKGNRECNYPSKSKTQKASRNSIKSKAVARDSESPSEAYESEDKDQLQAIPDADEDEDDEAEPASASSTGAPHSLRLEGIQRETSDPPSLSFDKSTSPSTEGSLSATYESARSKKGIFAPSRRPQHFGSVDQRLGISVKELDFFLEFYRKNITCHHYGWRLDGTEFLHTEFLQVASNYDPLLYAIAGFAAYHYTLSNPHGKLADFLQLYHISVSLLRISLRENEKHTEATLLTILQLATFEEYLGDWLNLIGHQKAALTILKALYTPESIQETPTLRMIFIWYFRFDISVGFLSGNGVILEREWIATCHEKSLERKEQNPSSVSAKIEEAMNHHRLLAADLAILFAKRTRSKKRPVSQSEQEFWAECSSLRRRIKQLEESWTPASIGPQNVATDSLRWLPRPQDSILDPRTTRLLFTGDFYPMNFAIMDMCALKVMFKHKLAQFQGKPTPLDCREEAVKAAQMFEAIELSPESRPGAPLAMHQAFAITCLFLPKDERTVMWLRRKFVSVEAKGYIFPLTLRRRMSRLWGVDVRNWWLPNDEGRPPILRATRDFVQARMSAPQDQFSRDVQDINGIFSSFDLEDPEQVGNAASSSSEQGDQGTTTWQALAALDETSMQQMVLDDQTTTSEDSPPRFLQEAARAQPGWGS
ncbi:hypothetical protein EV356DRAFT_444829 [Viridothelium virens]|uniref:Zn(2)-C6 fungal-type domain-containing protein n=1 Tax=Viridothelium virens TaxID=1048519 RepID=A0A6A6HDP9_VIRVR|nr:hypothetical protein EV356DRAFT_444829 [Viridothelium virens]